MRNMFPGRRKVNNVVILSGEAWPFSNESGNPVLQVFSQVISVAPGGMVILARVKVDFVDHVVSACIDYRNTYTKGKPGFEIDTTPCSIVSMSEICYEES